MIPRATPCTRIVVAFSATLAVSMFGPVSSPESAGRAGSVAPLPAPDPRTDITWITLPSGRFEMGSTTGEPNEKPMRWVTVRTFQLSRSEVTVAQYRRCEQAGKCDEPTSHETVRECNWGRKGFDHHPVNCVDWKSAVAYAAWAGARLPSEAEWEYAARSGGQRIVYPWGNQPPTCARAVFDDPAPGRHGCHGNRTWPVCSKPAGNSAQGICDLIGNVLEWTQDLYQESYADAPVDGSARKRAGTTNRVVRGGDYQQRQKQRSTQRDYDTPSNATGRHGFRVARPIP